MRPINLIPFLMLTACAASPETSQMESASPIDAAWQVSPWWQQFEDENLNQVVEKVLQVNLDLKAATARLRQAEIQTRIIAGEQMPTVTAGLQTARSRSNLIGLPFPGAPEVLPITSTQMGLGLSLSWELDLWGRMEAEEAAAIAQFEAGVQDWRGAQLSLSAQAAKVWLSMAEASDQLDFSRQLERSSAQLMEHLQSRFQRGTVPANALRDAQNSHSRFQAAIASREIQLDQQFRTLQILLSFDPRKEAALDQTAEMPDLPPVLPSGLTADLVSRRPDVAAAEARIHAAESQLSAAKSALYPRLSLTASGGTSSNTLGDLLDGDFRVWSLAGNLAAPLFQGGRLRSQVELRQSGIEESKLNFMQTAVRAYAEVEGGLLVEEQLRAQLSTLATILDRATKEEQRAQYRFNSGVGNFADLLQNRILRTQAESQLRSAHLQILLNRINLHLALGGDITTSVTEA